MVNYGLVSFDHLPIGMLTLFQCITLEGWTGMMYLMMDANMNVMAIVYFCLLTMFGSFFMLNLILAVIMDAFDQVDELQTEKEVKAKLELTKVLERHTKREDKMAKERAERDGLKYDETKQIIY